MKRTKVMIISFSTSTTLFIVLYLAIDFSIIFSSIIAIISYLLIYSLLSDASPLQSKNIDTDELIPYAKDLYSILSHTSNKIKDVDMKKNIHQLVNISYDVICHIENHPEDIEIARYFISSYLANATQLIQRYYELETKTSNNSIIKKSIESMKANIETIVTGFSNEYCKIMKDFVKDTDTLGIILVEQTNLDS